jgi:excisionase family DNA binding protein
MDFSYHRAGVGNYLEGTTVTSMNTSNDKQPDFESLLSPALAARLLDIHPVTLLRWAREDRVPCHRIGRKVKFRVSELNAWLATGYTKRAVRAA